jgi:uncharacterized protein YbjQ (UPF0145 family)
MKRYPASLIVLGVCLLAAAQVQARDTRHLFPIAAGMQGADSAKEKLDGSVKFYFGSQKHPKVLTKFGTDSVSRKTNAFGKSDETACNWVFLSALVALEKAAQSRGANAVVNVRSNYKHVEFSSPTEFECHAGAVMAGVALKGDFVKIADK